MPEPTAKTNAPQTQQAPAAKPAEPKPAEPKPAAPKQAGAPKTPDQLAKGAPPGPLVDPAQLVPKSPAALAPDPAAAFAKQLDRPGYAYLHPFASPLIAQLKTASREEQGKLAGKLDAMFAVSQSPDGHGLTDVKQASNRHHAELGTTAVERLRAQAPAPDAATAIAQSTSLARTIERDVDAKLEDGVHMSFAFPSATAAEAAGELDVEASIAPNDWKETAKLLGLVGLGVGVVVGVGVGIAMARRPTAQPSPAERTLEAACKSIVVAVRDALPGAEATLDGAVCTVTHKDRRDIVIRLQACPLGDRPMRVMVNPSKTHVLQVSETIDPQQIARALAGGVAEIARLVELAGTGGNLGMPDVMKTGGASSDHAALSPRDMNNIAQIASLAREYNSYWREQPGLEAVRTQLHGLIDQLGLRAGSPNYDARRNLAKPHLRENAMTVVEKLGAGPAELEQPAAPSYVSAQANAESQKPRDDRRTAREAPISGPTPAKIPESTALEMAQQAAGARATKSEQMVVKYRALAEQHQSVSSPQLGAGASLTAIRPGQLLVDEAGRWQRDPSRELAQTASQLRWVKEAGLGDPLDFVADPNERVPLAAVRYWEDTIAARADVINGRGAITATQHGLQLTIVPAAPPEPIELALEGTPLIGTGFPPEHIPRPRGPRAGAAQKTLVAALKGLGTGEGTTAGNALEGIDANDDAHIAAFFNNVTHQPPVEAVRNGGGEAAKALSVLSAAVPWVEHHGQPNGKHGAVDKARVLTGDEANTDALDPKAADHWVITGVGGTGISAAEIILDNNAHAFVTMFGGNATPGLFDNVQARRVMKQYGPTSATPRFQAITSQDVGALATSDDGGTFDVAPVKGDQYLSEPTDVSSLDTKKHRRWLVAAKADMLPTVRALCERSRRDEAAFEKKPKTGQRSEYTRILVTMVGEKLDDVRTAPDQLQGLLDEFGPVSGTIRFQIATGEAFKNEPHKVGNELHTDMFKVDGYIAAIGRGGNVAPLVSQLITSAKAVNATVAGELRWDDDRQYIGYRITVTPNGMDETHAKHVDVTGAASRFLPIPPFRTGDQEAVTKAGTFDAPPESGNFDGGFSASALQAQRYARQRRSDDEKGAVSALLKAPSGATLTLGPNEEKAIWETKVKDFLVAELNVPADRVAVKCVAQGKSGDSVFMVTVGEQQRVFKVFGDQAQQAQNEIAQLQWLAGLHLEKSAPISGQGNHDIGGDLAKKRTGIVMETAPGTSIEQLLDKLPDVGAPTRKPTIARMEKMAERVAVSLAELHAKTSNGSLMTKEAKETSADYIGTKLTGQASAFAPDADKITSAFEAVKQRFYAAPIPATAYHGDANAGNFILDETAMVRMIDVGGMKYSHKPGAGVGDDTGANDLARFTTSLETLKPGALQAGEVQQISNAFLTKYYAECKTRNLDVKPENMADAIKVYKVEVEIAAMRGEVGKADGAVAKRDAERKGRDRIKAVLGA